MTKGKKNVKYKDKYGITRFGQRGQPPVVSKDKRDLSEELTIKQRKFVRHLLDDPDLDEAKAAKAAGYKNGSVIGKNLALRPKIRKLIDRELAERARISAISGEKIVKEIADIAFLDPVDLFFEKDGKLQLKSLDDLTPLQRKLIDKIEIKTETAKVKGNSVTTTNISVSSITSDVKLKALTLLMKHKGMLVERKEEQHTHTVNWDDYYKARNDDMERNARKEEKEQDSIAFRRNQYHAEIQAERDSKKNMYGTLYEGGEEVVDAEYSVKDLLDSVDGDADLGEDA
jgi:phage terminase small subunit